MNQLSGKSLRSIAYEFEISVGKSYKVYFEALQRFPVVIDITRKYCSRFCGILLVDGKYVKVKGYKKKIPCVYAVDYMTHDIVHFVLGPSENYKLLLKFFSSLKLANYPLQAIVSDDNKNFPEAAQRVYPNAIWQLCQNHYKQNLRSNLGLYQNKKHLKFMKEVETLFTTKLSIQDFKSRASKIFEKNKQDKQRVQVMLDIAKRSPDLMAYTRLKHIPRTNNLIESFNSHLEGRLKTIKGFQNFKSANLWLNAYFIKRRLKPFTDCTKKFKKLNGNCSLQKTLKENYKPKDILALIK